LDPLEAIANDSKIVVNEIVIDLCFEVMAPLMALIPLLDQLMNENVMKILKTLKTRQSFGFEVLFDFHLNHKSHDMMESMEPMMASIEDYLVVVVVVQQNAI
jgi:hypothetical protein